MLIWSPVSLKWFVNMNFKMDLGQKISSNNLPIIEHVTTEYLPLVEMRFSLFMSSSVYNAYSRLHTCIIHFPSQVIIILDFVLLQFQKLSISKSDFKKAKGYILLFRTGNGISLSEWSHRRRLPGKWEEHY